MKLIASLRRLAVTVAAVGILLPHSTITTASENGTIDRRAAAVCDLELGDGGVLRGQVMNNDGLPAAEASVVLMRDAGTVASVKADDQGAFAIAGISGGLYAITSGKATGVVRAWSHGSAPPAASQGVLLVPSDLTVRGQGHLREWLQTRNRTGLSLSQIGLGGLIVLGLVGTIIVVSLDNDDAS